MVDGMHFTSSFSFVTLAKVDANVTDSHVEYSSGAARGVMLLNGPSCQHCPKNTSWRAVPYAFHVANSASRQFGQLVTSFFKEWGVQIVIFWQCCTAFIS